MLDLYLTGHGYPSVMRAVVSRPAAGVHLSIADIILLAAAVAAGLLAWRFTPGMLVVLFLVAAGGKTAAGEAFPAAEELLAADRAFARASAERGAEAWAEVWAGQGLLYGDGSAPAVGPDAASSSVAAIASALRWKPTASAMLWPGRLGYTVGDWWMRADPDGERGRYLTVWHRIGGDWKVVLDLSLPRRQASGAARDFDFWLGDWRLDQRIWSGDGDDFEPYAARNQVRLIEDGGALVENFEGRVRFFWLDMEEPAHIRGVSVRVHYPDAREWRIFWMDTLDPKFGLPFRGGFSGSVGEFLLNGGPEGARPTRIRFERRPDGSVDWQLSLRRADGAGWQPLWLIDFRRPE